MNFIINKIAIVFSCISAVWFAFFIVQQPIAPVYHSIILFFISWMLFYAIIDILTEPLASLEAIPRKKIRHKIKNTPKESL